MKYIPGSEEVDMGRHLALKHRLHLHLDLFDHAVRVCAFICVCACLHGCVHGCVHVGVH